MLVGLVMLHHVNDGHFQAYDLRTAIPQMLAPLNNLRRLPSAPSSDQASSRSNSPSSSPISPPLDVDGAAESSSAAIDPKQAEIIFHAFQATVAKTMADLESFRQLWNDAQTAAAMNRAAQSEAADDQGIMACIFGDNVGSDKVGSLGMEGDGDPRFEREIPQGRDGGGDVTMSG